MSKDHTRPTDSDYWAIRENVRIPHTQHTRTPLLTLDQVLARDGFQCMLTGMIDEVSLRHNAELKLENKRLNRFPGFIETSYIVNEPTRWGIGISENATAENEVHTAAGPSIIACSHQIPDLWYPRRHSHSETFWT